MSCFQTEEKFWWHCIESLRKKDYATNKKYCGDKSSKFHDSYCDDRRMVDMVTAAVYHSSGDEGGLDWVKMLEEGKAGLSKE